MYCPFVSYSDSLNRLSDIGGDCNENFKNSKLTGWMEEKSEGSWLEDSQFKKNGEQAEEANWTEVDTPAPVSPGAVQEARGDLDLTSAMTPSA